jgi:hypothetical protein
LLADGTAGFLLFVPHPTRLESGIHAQLERSRAVVISLAEVLEFQGDGELRVLPNWQAYCNSYRSRYLSDHVSAAEASYSFEKTSMWEILERPVELLMSN